ncbi:MAG: septum formation inhibitor Maf [Flavobacteriaceae bacterium]|jgi:hypothetical protein|nr:septum formation inhibitor Maf [Flavobacteriaceae bacterium]MDO7614860.1 septum formation inhibitor Maf [Flavobacteriaceae bacterium]|tara:strand:- start:1417 stop:2295 length:879 start_codon:yes stop_codon:yes gene_type:complete
MMKKAHTLFFIFSLFGFLSINAQRVSEQFKKHWFDGNAEISSYSLEQSRYGEIRDGSAVLIFVTEDFLNKEQVKANQKSKNTIPVIKSNRTKKFLTGIYPYSIMSSSFSAIKSPQNIVKSSASIQEWCGQSYLQINKREKQLEITSHSYFEGEADQNFKIAENRTEDELWNLIRMGPQNLPLGKIKLVPSLESSRLNHEEIRAHQALAEMNQKEKTTVYTITYHELKRSIAIEFNTAFPHSIEGWVEKNIGKGAAYVSTAKKIHTERRQYWRENNNASKQYRVPFKIDLNEK